MKHVSRNTYHVTRNMKHLPERLKSFSRAGVTRNNSGFTLIETLVYLGLFAMLIGGSVSAAYNVIEASNRSQTKAMVYEEGNFLINKINWALSSVQAVNSPNVGTTGSELAVTKFDASIGSVSIKLLASDMAITRSGSTLILNNSNVEVTNLTFTHEQSEGAESVTALLTLSARTPDGKTLTSDFETTKYLKK